MSIAGAALDRGVVLIGCGKMGGALMSGWVDAGLPASSMAIIDPYPGAAAASFAAKGAALNPGALPDNPSAVVVAVKPQLIAEALPLVGRMAGPDVLVLSIAAGVPMARFEAAAPPGTPIVRAMPNTPAAVGRGVTALVGNRAAGAQHLDRAEALMASVGEVVRLGAESLMDAVTAVSGSGPAYVFHMIEALAAAGEAEGLPADLAMRLARATVTGAGELAHRSAESAAELRVNVTSPGGTTAAALAVLMDPESGLPPLMRRAVQAAAARSRELGS